MVQHYGRYFMGFGFYLRFGHFITLFFSTLNQQRDSNSLNIQCAALKKIRFIHTLKMLYGLIQKIFIRRKKGLIRFYFFKRQKNGYKSHL